MKITNVEALYLRQSKVKHQCDQRLRVDLTLALGAVDQEVQVAGNSLLLSSQSATVDQVIFSKEAVDLPRNGRNWLDLATRSRSSEAMSYHWSGLCSGKRGDRKTTPVETGDMVVR